ncbi:MAG: hypothetical protein Q4D80_05105 [Pseudomonadota bacterium]|nr:hypothetical protein [Pseudomonadota bacterium]
MAACLCYASTVSARTCFLPDSEDCGEGTGEVPDADVTCASYGGYDSEAECKTDYSDVAVVCSQNNGCYYPYCQYSSERACLKDITSSEKCLSKNVTDLDKTCWYKTGKTCSELNAKYVSNSGSCQANYKKQEVPGVSGSDGQCYTCEMNKTCKQLNAGYYTESELCPENTDRKDTGKTGSDGKCYTCENKRCSDLGWQVSGSCSENEKETVVGTGIEGTCVTCTLKTCKEINSSWMTKTACAGVATSTGTTGLDGECCTCVLEECPQGYSVDVTSCPSGYKLDPNGTAYGKTCNKCIEEKCPTNYSVDVTSCSEGYRLDSNGKSGTKDCNRCVDAPCPEGYFVDVTCPDGYKLESNGKSGTKTCGKCVINETIVITANTFFDVSEYPSRKEFNQYYSVTVDTNKVPNLEVYLHSSYNMGGYSETDNTTLDVISASSGVIPSADELYGRGYGLLTNIYDKNAKRYLDSDSGIVDSMSVKIDGQKVYSTTSLIPFYSKIEDNPATVEFSYNGKNYQMVPRMESNDDGKTECEPGYLPYKPNSNIFNYVEKDGCYMVTSCKENMFVSAKEKDGCTYIKCKSTAVESGGKTCYIRWPASLVFYISMDTSGSGDSMCLYKLGAYWCRDYNEVCKLPDFWGNYDTENAVKMMKDFIYLKSINSGSTKYENPVSFSAIVGAMPSTTQCPSNDGPTLSWADYYLKDFGDDDALWKKESMSLGNYEYCFDHSGFVTDSSSLCTQIKIRDGNKQIPYSTNDSMTLCANIAENKVICEDIKVELHAVSNMEYRQCQGLECPH